ncbi:MAG: hypothetical protein CNCCGFBP_00215 [Fimbriimonadaceae bacterium]|nr:hypothetical protein [Fimbriimonadaceae bacterium]
MTLLAEDKRLFEVEIQPPTPEEIERQRVREEYRAKLAEKLKDPEFRKIEGFPIGTDEAILALSDPPYYTACPNPFIEEWLKEHGKPFDPDTDDYHREPFAADVSEGKNDPIYNAHSYHTKVPHRALVHYILHYTEPGEIVLDAFAGTGMTGVAAAACGDETTLKSLGYSIDSNGSITSPSDSRALSQGVRFALLQDLSPIATSIASVFNSRIETERIKTEAKAILSRIEMDLGWMYSTIHNGSSEIAVALANSIAAATSIDALRSALLGVSQRAESPVTLGRINFIVWSDVYVCSHCGSEIVYWDAAIDKSGGEVQDSFCCPACQSTNTKTTSEKSMATLFDQHLGIPVSRSKQVPVLITYTVGKKRIEKRADAADVALAQAFERLSPSAWYPTLPMMHLGEKWGDSWRSGYHRGVTHSHHFFMPRTLHALSIIWERLQSLGAPGRFLFTSTLPWTTRQNRLLISNYFKKRGGVIGQTLAGTLYLSSIAVETNPINRFELRCTSAFFTSGQDNSVVSTQSATRLQSVGNSSIDYVFTDPPFGGNLMYSELNFVWESWLGVTTNIEREAITNASQGKGVAEYQLLMTRCFAEYFRVLKPGRWMTVEFHNSANAVWNAIQEAIETAGFIVADIRILTKEHNTFKQVNNATAVKQDLAISCYRPHSGFEERFRVHAGQVQGVLDFVHEHLGMLPVVPRSSSGSILPVAERSKYLLFDRMVAYHLRLGHRVPVSASEFYALLDAQLFERDGMYFTAEQVSRYDLVKSQGVEVEQLSIFVRDEKSAVQWVRNELEKEPHTLGELTPKFMQASQDWGQHEVMPELRDLLQQYFIREGDETWVVPNPDNEKHLEEVRRKAMLREFQEYVRRKGQLKLFRTEALLAGFAHCWDSKQYDVIVGVCEKIPPKVLQEIQDLVMFYDIAKERAPEKVTQFEFKWE